MTEPILAVRTIPSGYNPKINLTFRVEGGLHYLHGNNEPYFSLTYWSHRKGHPNQCQSGGAGHDEILKYYPQFADLAALHLSDIHGAPMHAAVNGWYNLAGYLPDNGGERYHVGNSERHFPKATIDPDTPWNTTDYRKPSAEECLQIFADYVRLPIEACRNLARLIEQTALAGIEERKALESAGYASAGVSTAMARYDWTAARRIFNEWIEQQKPRWQAEADACIKKHGLRVYGDAWPNNSGSQY
jgi:hypothetical protein